MSCKRCLESTDLLGVPVSLNIKKQPVFVTAFGGCCSIGVILLIVIYLLDACYQLIWSPSYNQSFGQNQINQLNDYQPYEIQSEQLILAAMLFDSNDVKVSNLSDVVQINYFQQYGEWSDSANAMQKTNKKLPTATCLDIFNSTGPLRDEFKDTKWTCSSQDEFYLMNNPDIEIDYSQYSMVVNYCYVAEPDNTSCMDKESAQEYLENVAIRTKTIAEYFDPQVYDEFGRQGYYTFSRNVQGLSSNCSTGTLLTVILNTFYYFPQKFIGLSSIANLFSYEFQNYVVDDSQYCRFNDRTDEDTYGIYSVTLQQGSHNNTISISITAFDNIVSNLGGFQAFLFTGLGFFVSFYQTFRFQNELVSELYTKTPEQSNDLNLNDDQMSDYDAMKAKLQVNQPHMLSFSNWIFKTLYESFCIHCCKKRCCRKRQLEFQIHNEALKRLQTEIDLFNLIDNSRIAKFMCQMEMSQSKHKMIKYFRLYHLESSNLYLPESVEIPMEELLSKFDPENNMVDKRILYEITGRKHDDLEYEDDDQVKGQAFQLHQIEDLTKSRITSIMNSSIVQKIADMDFKAIND